MQVISLFHACSMFPSVFTLCSADVVVCSIKLHYHCYAQYPWYIVLIDLVLSPLWSHWVSRTVKIYLPYLAIWVILDFTVGSPLVILHGPLPLQRPIPSSPVSWPLPATFCSLLRVSRLYCSFSSSSKYLKRESRGPSPSHPPPGHASHSGYPPRRHSSLRKTMAFKSSTGAGRHWDIIRREWTKLGCLVSLTSVWLSLIIIHE